MLVFLVPRRRVVAGPETRVQSGVWPGHPDLALLFIYSPSPAISTHGSEMYLKPSARGQGNLKVADQPLAFSHMLAKWVATAIMLRNLIIGSGIFRSGKRRFY